MKHIPEEWMDAFCRSLPAPKPVPEGFSSEEFIAEMLQRRCWDDPDCGAALDRLCKKVDVVGRVACGYMPDLASAILPEPVATVYAHGLCALCLACAERQRQYKFLNTALKLLDGRLGPETQPPPESLRRWAQALLETIAAGGCRP